MSVGQNTDLILLKVLGVTDDPNTDTQIVILRDEANADILPIWMGPAEGTAIRYALEDTVLPRPTSHDLMASLLTHLGITMTHVVVTNVQDNTYYAMIYLDSNGRERTVDARPSDAIALALRSKCPIYVTQDVLKNGGGTNVATWLAKLGPQARGQTETQDDSPKTSQQTED